jgi:hypothetical protein
MTAPASRPIINHVQHSHDRQHSLDDLTDLPFSMREYLKG